MIPILKKSTNQTTDSFSSLVPKQNQRILVDNVAQKSMVCDLQKPGEKPHKLGSSSLRSDPLERDKPITNTDGKEVE